MLPVALQLRDVATMDLIHTIWQVIIFKEHPETRRNLIIHHCVMPIVDMLENGHDHQVLVRILKVINQVRMFPSISIQPPC